MSQQPFVGLRPFNWDESDIFFGREKCVVELAQLLQQSNFFSVVGEPFCGKTSLLRCGLEGHLRRSNAEQGQDCQWHIAYWQPGDNPFKQLALALPGCGAFGQNFLQGFESPDAGIHYLEQVLSQNSLSIHQLLDNRPLAKGHQLVLICDQFEQLFHLHQTNPRLAQDFVNLLIDTSKAHPIRQSRDATIHIIIGLRSTYLDKCPLFPQLTEAIKTSIYLVPRLTTAQLIETIKKPVLLYKGNIDDDLIQKILSDVENKFEHLPFLQHLLARMWELVMNHEQPHLNLTLYNRNKIHSLEDALALHLEETYECLKDIQPKIAETLFRQLTLVTDNTRPRLLHKPVPIRDIAKLAQVKWEDVAKVVEIFRQSGRHFLLPLPPTALLPNTPIEIAHETIARHWPRLEKWKRMEYQAAKNYQLLQQHASLYFDRQGDLLKPPLLDELWHWYKQGELTEVAAENHACNYYQLRNYLNKSKTARSLLVGIAGGVALCGLASLAFLWKDSIVQQGQKQRTLEVLIDLNETLITPENSSQVIAKFDELTKNDPQNPDAWFYYGLGLNQQQKPNDAIAAFRQALTLDPHNVVNLYHLGKILKQQEKWDEAADIFKQGLREDSDNVIILQALADTLVEQDNLDEAVNYYQTALEIEPENDVTLAELGHLLSLQDKIPEAIEKFMQALKTNSNNDETWRLLGQALLKINKVQQAVDALNEATRINSHKDENWRWLGLALMRQNNLSKAIQVFNQALQLNENSDENWINLGDALSKNNQLDEALKAYHNALKIKADSSNLKQLAELLTKQQKYNEAIEIYRQALSLKPEPNWE